jgi:hypothetical protein
MAAKLLVAMSMNQGWGLLPTKQPSVTLKAGPPQLLSYWYT